MSFWTSATCDNCEHHLQADNEDQVLAAGWFLVKWGPDEEPQARDFCSVDCLLVWFSKSKIETSSLDDGATA